MDGSPVAALPPVMVTFQFAPLPGISVGADQAGPAGWELSRRRGHYLRTGTPRRVTCLPGPKADCNPETLVAAAREREGIYG